MKVVFWVCNSDFKFEQEMSILSHMQGGEIREFTNKFVNSLVRS